jgi:hypothetical protein
VRHQVLNIGKLRSPNKNAGAVSANLIGQQNTIIKPYEAWGKGRRFGFVRINDQKVYWYAVVNENLVKNPNNLAELFVDLIQKFQE